MTAEGEESQGLRGRVERRAVLSHTRVVVVAGSSRVVITQGSILRYLAVLFTTMILAACGTAPDTSNATRAASPPQVLAPELRNASIDSVVQFLLTAAATDFRLHGPSGPIRFREVRIGHVLTPDSGNSTGCAASFCARRQKASISGRLS